MTRPDPTGPDPRGLARPVKAGISVRFASKVLLSRPSLSAGTTGRQQLVQRCMLNVEC